MVIKGIILGVKCEFCEKRNDLFILENVYKGIDILLSEGDLNNN